MTEPDGVNSDELMATVLKLTGLAAHVERIDQGTRQRFEELGASCSEALKQIAAVRQEAGLRADGMEQRLAEIGGLIAQMSSQITELAEFGAPVADDEEDHAVPYTVNPAPPWWQPGHDRTVAATMRLREWVNEVYRPGFGYLGAKLGECWDKHPLCLAYLDALHEAWCLLYIPPRDPKMVFAQLDWLTRPLLQAAEVMAAETAPCLHMGHPSPDRVRSRASGRPHSHP